MFGAIAKAVFGSANDRYVRSLDKTIATINALEPQLESFSDEELAAQTAKFREQLAAGKTLDDILP
jgi:preprotein translocase subunit SecA